MSTLSQYHFSSVNFSFLVYLIVATICSSSQVIGLETDFKAANVDVDENKDISSRVQTESKKLWCIVGPDIISRLANFSMTVITQAFAGHLGDVQLASISIANNIIVGFGFGLLLGLASALETLCGQAFGAKRHHMLGIYLQRSWIVLLLCCILLLPVFIFASPILKLLGQPEELAEQSATVALWLIPLHFSLAFHMPMQCFLQSQLKNFVTLWMSLVVLVLHVVTSWVLVYVLDLGVVGAAIALDISSWAWGFGLFWYCTSGRCHQTWTGFSMQAFSGIWEFLKFSTASGVMLCLEYWSYKILILMTGLLENATLSVDALSICMTMNGWALCFHLAFLVGTGVRVANELGSGNSKASKFAVGVSIVQSAIIGLFFSVLILILHDKFGYIFTTSPDVLKAVDQMSHLLAAAILVNSIQPVFTGVVVGSGWQAWVAYINLFSYYIVGLPLAFVLGWIAHLGVSGIWGGMIFGGTAVQTILSAIIVLRNDWEKETQKASQRVKQWSTPKEDEHKQNKVYEL